MFFFFLVAGRGCSRIDNSNVVPVVKNPLASAGRCEMKV